MVEIIDGESYLTLKEAAQRLRRCYKTVWLWTLTGRISYHQITPGFKILIPEREINRLSSGQ